MNAMHRFCRVLSRLVRGRMTWLAVSLTILSPLAGLTIYRPAYSADTGSYVTAMTGMYAANPALAGGLIGAAAFAVLTIWELDRVRRGNMETLTDAVIPPQSAAWRRLLALLALSVLTQAVTMLAWLPWSIHALGAVFDGGSYFWIYAVFMYGALPLAILLAASAYKFTRRMELSLLICAALAALSFTVWSYQWPLHWLNPPIFSISDDFSNDRLIASVAYMRLIWLAALFGVWGLSCLCLCRYGKGLAGSFCRNARKVYRPMLSAVALSCAVLLYMGQPFLDHSEMEMDYDFLYPEEYLETVSCQAWHADVRPEPATGRLYGTAVYQLVNTAKAEQAIRFHIKPGYSVSSVQANGAEAPFSLGARENMNERELTVTLPAEEQIELSIRYGGYPQEWNNAGVVMGEQEISGQYMNLETETLAPMLYDVGSGEELMQATVDLTLPGGISAVPFGSAEAAPLRQNADGTWTWRIEGWGNTMTVFAGDYIREDIPIESAGLTVQFYYARKHSAVMRAAGAAESIRETIEYCTRHIGPLYFYGDGVFKLIENRGGGGGYAADGASLANELDFTAQNLSDSAKGGAPAQVMIHEIVHQWWGLGNMFDFAEEDGPWSAEGLACYTTYRIVKELYGEETARREYVARWQEEVDAYYKDFYVRHPEYLNALPEQYQTELANSLRGVRHYNEMPLKILKAEKLVGSEEAMDAILSGLFNRELDPMYPYLTYQDFLDACGLTEEALMLDETVSI